MHAPGCFAMEHGRPPGGAVKKHQDNNNLYPPPGAYFLSDAIRVATVFSIRVRAVAFSDQ